MPGRSLQTSRRHPQDGTGGFIALIDRRRVDPGCDAQIDGKGFNTQQIRECFEVLRKSKMIINAYFIVGNIGETESKCSPRPRSLDPLAWTYPRFQAAASDPYSGLKELVENMPGYHIDSDGFVYSDQYSASTSPICASGSDGEFYTPLHVAGVVLS